jgi:hypothetical protein
MKGRAGISVQVEAERRVPEEGISIGCHARSCRAHHAEGQPADTDAPWSLNVLCRSLEQVQSAVSEKCVSEVIVELLEAQE